MYKHHDVVLKMLRAANKGFNGLECSGEHDDGPQTGLWEPGEPIYATCSPRQKHTCWDGKRKQGLGVNAAGRRHVCSKAFRMCIISVDAMLRNAVKRKR